MGNKTSYFSTDPILDCVTVINAEHLEIHEGDHYNYCAYALNQASGAEIDFFLTVGTEKAAHFTFQASSSEGATLDLYEGATGASGGTPIIPRNNNRISANSSTVTMLKDPSTITSLGVNASGYLAGGGRTAGFTSRDKEFILKPGNTYFLRITSLATSNDISWCADWYEH